MLTWSFKHLSPTIPHYRFIFALIFVGAPLVLPAFIDVTFHTRCISHRFSLLCAWATTRIRSKNDHDACTQYASPEAEERYWASARSWEKRLASSNARVKADAKIVTTIPLVMSYTPALPPRYRIRYRDTTTSATLAGEGEYYLSARVFCKWHRMVFPGPTHPTLQQASKLRNNFSNRDRREMYRISRMLSDEIVFGCNYRWTSKYRDLWQRWMVERGADVDVVFA